MLGLIIQLINHLQSPFVACKHWTIALISQNKSKLNSTLGAQCWSLKIKIKI